VPWGIPKLRGSKPCPDFVNRMKVGNQPLKESHDFHAEERSEFRSASMLSDNNCTAATKRRSNKT
jgi:hypothetical protein